MTKVSVLVDISEIDSADLLAELDDRGESRGVGDFSDHELREELSNRGGHEAQDDEAFFSASRDSMKLGRFNEALAALRNHVQARYGVVL